MPVKVLQRGSLHIRQPLWRLIKPSNGSLALPQVYAVPQEQANLTTVAMSADGTVATFQLAVPAQTNSRNASFGHSQVS